MQVFFHSALIYKQQRREPRVGRSEARREQACRDGSCGDSALEEPVAVMRFRASGGLGCQADLVAAPASVLVHAWEDAVHRDQQWHVAG